MRQSIGASQGRIFRMLLAEGLVLSLTGLAAAWLFTIWAAKALPRVVPPERGVQLSVDFAPDWRVAAYGFVLAGFSTLAFTLMPAVRAWRVKSFGWVQRGCCPGSIKPARV